MHNQSKHTVNIQKKKRIMRLGRDQLLELERNEVFVQTVSPNLKIIFKFLFFLVSAPSSYTIFPQSDRRNQNCQMPKLSKSGHNHFFKFLPIFSVFQFG